MTRRMGAGLGYFGTGREPGTPIVVRANEGTGERLGINLGHQAALTGPGVVGPPL
jgi:hypothetical protein